MRTFARAVIAAAGGVLALSALTACTPSADPAARASSQAPSSAPAAAALTVVDGWAKAAESGMTSAFATLENHGASPVTVVSARSDAAATVELHRTVQDGSGGSSMQRADDGFTVPAGGSLELAPGGEHIMLMGLTGPIAPGDTVTIVLTLSDGGTVTVRALAKAYSGAGETYDPGTGATPTPGAGG